MNHIGLDPVCLFPNLRIAGNFRSFLIANSIQPAHSESYFGQRLRSKAHDNLQLTTVVSSGTLNWLTVVDGIVKVKDSHNSDSSLASVMGDDISICRRSASEC